MADPFPEDLVGIEEPRRGYRRHSRRRYGFVSPREPPRIALPPTPPAPKPKVTFAVPQRPARGPGTAMYEPERRPTPFPLVEDHHIREVERQPTPTPVPNGELFGQPSGHLERPRTPFPTVQDRPGLAQHPVATRNPAISQPPLVARQAVVQARIEERREDERCARQQRRWPLTNSHRIQDDEYEPPRLRDVARQMLFDREEEYEYYDEDEDDGPHLSIPQELERNPLYGRFNVGRDGYGQYQPTPRFETWLEDAHDGFSPVDDWFTQWLRGKAAQDAQRHVRNGQDQPRRHKDGSDDAAAGSGEQESASKEEAKPKRGKRGGDDGSSEARPSKRARLFGTIRCKVSFRSSGTGDETAQDSGETSIRVVKRSSAFDSLNLNPFGSIRAFSRASSVGPKTVRIAVVGDSSSGKTAMLNRLYRGKFMPTEKSTHYMNADFGMTVDGHLVILEAWDIPGDLPASETHPLNTAFFHAALVCFSVKNAKNAEQTTHWLNVLQSCLVEVPTYVVGLKSDTRPSFPSLRLPFLNEGTPATRMQGEDAARSVGAVDYFECSAKTGDGVKNVFHTVIRHATSKLDEDELKRASRLRRQKIKRGIEDTRRKFSNLFCSSPRKLSHRLA